MKTWVLFFAMCSLTNATFLRLFRTSIGLVSKNKSPIKTYYSSEPHQPLIARYPYLNQAVPYSIIPVDYNGGNTDQYGYHIPVSSNYDVASSNGPVINRGGFTYAYQPEGTHEEYIHGDTNLDTTKYSVNPVLDSSQGFLEKDVNQELSSKFTSPIYVGSTDFAFPAAEGNGYDRSYTLDDGTQVTERGKLVTLADGTTVLVKDGQYQYKKSDGEIVTVNWNADENGFVVAK